MTNYPAQQTPSNLQKNLAVLIARYPEAAQRLVPELLKPATIALPKEFTEIPDTPTDLNPYPRVLLIVGMRDPRWLVNISKHPFLGTEIAQYFIFEDDIELLRACFQQADISQILSVPNFHYFFTDNEEDIRKYLFKTLADSECSKVMENATALLDLDIDPNTFLGRIPLLYREVVEHVYHNYGQIDDSLDGVKATLANTEFIRTASGIKELKNRFKNVPCVIAGAGPSLDEELDNIKNNRSKFMLLAVDAALKPLLAAGIQPDYVFGLERNNLWQTKFYTDITPGCELICYPVLAPEVLSAYQGDKRVVYRNYSYFAFWEKQAPKGLMRSGGSVIHLASVLAQYFGCKDIMLVGSDCAYEGDDIKGYRSHCKNTGYPEWATYQPLEFYPKERNHAPAFKVTANDGSEIVTNMTYYQFAKEFGAQVIDFSKNVSFKTSAAKGVQIPDVPYQMLSDWLKDKDIIDLKKPVNVALDLCKDFGYTMLMKQVKAWLRVSMEILKSVQDNAKEPRDLELVRITLHELLEKDSMFVSFVLQNCAAELYQNENKIYGLPFDWDGQFEERKQLIEARLELYQSVLMKLAKILGDHLGESNV